MLFFLSSNNSLVLSNNPVPFLAYNEGNACLSARGTTQLSLTKVALA